MTKGQRKALVWLVSQPSWVSGMMMPRWLQYRSLRCLQRFGYAARAGRGLATAWSATEAGRKALSPCGHPECITRCAHLADKGVLCRPAESACR